MFDAKLRPLIDPPLNAIGRKLADAGVSADALTIAGATTGVLAGVAIGFGQFGLGLLLIIVSRLLDGLDGAVARATKITDFGGFLDILADFFFYVSVPLGFGFAAAETMPFAAALIASFALTGVSFLSYAAVAAGRGETTDDHGKKSIFYNTGLAEGTETIIAFVLMCLMPAQFALIAGIYTAMCVLTVFQRIATAHRNFR